MSIATERLIEHFVAQEGESLRPELERPFVVALDGQEFTIATNGWRLIALPGIVGDPVRSGVERAKHVPALLAEKAKPVGVVTLDAFRTFAGATRPDDCGLCGGNPETDCPKCRGVGSYSCTCLTCDDEHDADCDECDGEGVLLCEACSLIHEWGKTVPVRIGQHYFNKSNVRAVVRWLPGETVALSALPDPNRPLHVISEDFHVLVMAIRADHFSDEALRRAPSLEIGLALSQFPDSQQSRGEG